MPISQFSKSTVIGGDARNVFTTADDVATAVKIIVDFKESSGRSGIKLPNGMKKT